MTKHLPFLRVMTTHGFENMYMDSEDNQNANPFCWYFHPIYFTFSQLFWLVKLYVFFFKLLFYGLYQKNKTFTQIRVLSNLSYLKFYMRNRWINFPQAFIVLNFRCEHSDNKIGWNNQRAETLPNLLNYIELSSVKSNR